MPRRCDAQHYAYLREKPDATTIAAVDTPNSNATTPAKREETKHYLSINDYRSLVRQASTQMACFDLSPGVPITTSTGTFVSQLYTQQSVCVEASNTLVRSLGHRDIEDALGRSIEHVFPPCRNWQSVFAEWHQRSLTREPIEIELLSRDETPWTAQCVMYGSTHKSLLIRFWIVARDISTQKSAIRSLNRIDTHYQAILNTPDTLYLRLTDVGSCDYASPATIALLGVLDGHSLARPGAIYDMIHPDDRRHLCRQLQLPLGNEIDSSSKPIRFRLRDGTFARFAARWYAVASSSGASSSGASSSGDTLRYDLIATRLAPKNEFHRRRRSESARITEHLHTAHDLNNLLTVLQANLELATRTPDYLAPLRAAERALNSCVALTQRFFASSAISATTSSIQLGPALREIVKSLRAVVPTTIDLVLSTPLPEVRVNGETSDLFQIISNLVFNARAALENSGAIHISAEETKGDRRVDAKVAPQHDVCVRVSDNGPGMPSHIRDLVFKERFTTQESSSNHGFGLGSVKQVVERLQGSIEIQSSPSAGTTITVRLPVVETSQKEPNRSSESSSRPCSIETPSLRILVADDEPLIRQMFNAILSNMGHSVHLVPNGELLLRQLQTATTDFDVVIIDDQMPDSRATTLITSALAIRPDLTILIASGNPTLSEDLTKRYTSVPFLRKPFTRAEIEITLRDLHRKKNSTDHPY